MKQNLTPEKAPFFNRFTATRDRPLGFQITVAVLFFSMVVLALATALLHL